MLLSPAASILNPDVMFLAALGGQPRDAKSAIRLVPSSRPERQADRATHSPAGSVHIRALRSLRGGTYQDIRAITDRQRVSLAAARGRAAGQSACAAGGPAACEEAGEGSAESDCMLGLGPLETITAGVPGNLTQPLRPSENTEQPSFGSQNIPRAALTLWQGVYRAGQTDFGRLMD